tara:strand:- start:1466 stop:1807 length:342 start_codon:yes stop_codon:yes gene_type:complete
MFASIKMALKIFISQNKYEGKRKYKLDESAQKRRTVLDAEINNKSKMDKITVRSAAQKKKARLNALRIYRKNSSPGTAKYKHCNVLTRDMKYLDRKYLAGKGKTNAVCGTRKM